MNPTSRRYSGLRKTLHRSRERRLQALVVVGVLAFFVVALLLYVLPGSGGGDEARPGLGGSAHPAASTLATTAVPSLTTSSAAGAVGSRLAGLPALTGLPNSTSLTTLGPGQHRIVLTASSDQPMLAVSYRVRGAGTGKIFYNVKSPVVISRSLTGARPYAAIALQVGPNGRLGTCRITIDGQVVDTRSIAKPYAVMGCVG